MLDTEAIAEAIYNRLGGDAGATVPGISGTVPIVDDEPDGYPYIQIGPMDTNRDRRGGFKRYVVDFEVLIIDRNPETGMGGFDKSRKIRDYVNNRLDDADDDPDFTIVGANNLIIYVDGTAQDRDQATEAASTDEMTTIVAVTLIYTTA